MLFKEEWFGYYDVEPLDLIVTTTVDPAGWRSKGDSDYNAIVTTGKSLKSGRIYVLDAWKKRANPGEVIEELFRQVDVWKPLKVGVEAVAYQSTLVYWIRERMVKEEKFFSIEALNFGKMKKVDRVRSLQPPIENGAIVFRKNQKDLIGELLACPYGAHDDLADCLAMQSQMWEMTKKRGDGEGARGRDPFSFDLVLEERDRKARELVRMREWGLKRGGLSWENDLQMRKEILN